MGNNCCFNDRNFPQAEKGALFICNDEIYVKSLESKIKKLETHVHDLHEKMETVKKLNNSLGIEKGENEKKIQALINSYDIIIKELYSKIEGRVYPNGIKPSEVGKQAESSLPLLPRKLDLINDPAPLNYDLSVPLKSLVQLKEGVKIQNAKNLEKFAKYQQAFYIGFLGLSGVGKTCIAKQLEHRQKDGTYIEPTENLNFKYLPRRDSDIQTNIIIDIPGLNGAIDCDLDTFLELESNQKTLDNFYTKFIENVAGVLVYVINKTSKNDQLLLKTIKQNNTNKEDKPMVIVLHNFSDIMHEQELQKRIETDIARPFKTSKCEIRFNEQILTAYIANDILHFVFGRIGKFNENNNKVISFLEYAIQSNKKAIDHGKFGPISALGDFMNNNLMEMLDLHHQVHSQFDDVLNTLSIEVTEDYLNVEAAEEDISNFDFDSKTSQNGEDDIFSNSENDNHNPNKEEQDNNIKVENEEVEALPKGEVIEDLGYAPDYKMIQDSTGITLTFELPNFDMESMKFKIIPKSDNSNYTFYLEGERNREGNDQEEEKDTIILRKSEKPNFVMFHENIKLFNKTMNTKNYETIYEQGVLKFKIPFLSEGQQSKLPRSWENLDDANASP
jgi:GTPase SAR1 family protein/HSP20 family molecular chaperone IbpA